MAIFTGILWIVGGACIPETYPPVLLHKRAARLSYLTGKVYKSKLDLGPKKRPTLGEAFKTALSRPWVLLFREPIVMILSIYIAIIYGTLYMLFAAFPIVYQQGRGWSEGIGGLSFLGVAVGMIIATVRIPPPRYEEFNLTTLFRCTPCSITHVTSVLGPKLQPVAPKLALHPKLGFHLQWWDVVSSQSGSCSLHGQTTTVSLGLSRSLPRSPLASAWFSSSSASSIISLMRTLYTPPAFLRPTVSSDLSSVRPFHYSHPRCSPT